MNAQEEPVILLLVSFLTCACMMTVDELLLFDEDADVGKLTIKHKIFNFLTHFFPLSRRLFRVRYFTVSYQWWVIRRLFVPWLCDIDTPISKKSCRRERRMAVVERRLHDRKEVWFPYLVCKINEFFACCLTNGRLAPA